LARVERTLIQVNSLTLSHQSFKGEIMAKLLFYISLIYKNELFSDESKVGGFSYERTKQDC
jgi:hypothetical protein